MTSSSTAKTIRINAFLASAGLGSRRSVEELIREGEVRVNGEVLRDLSHRVDPENDVVLLRGKRVQSHRHRYIVLNKPPGYTCTKEDRHAKRTIYDLLPRDLHSLNHVGRLDQDSQGLLLLSNDGQWTQRILHPANEIQKVYEVEVRGFPTDEDLSRATKGIRDGDDVLKIESFRYIAKKANASIWELVLHQGRKREIRRIFDVLRYRINHLKRLSIGKLKLGNLRVGLWRELTKSERDFF